MVSIETVSIIVAAVGVFLAAINQIVSSRRAERQQQTQLFMQLYNQWSTRDMAKQYGRIRYEHHLSVDEWNQTVIAPRDDGLPTMVNADIYADFQSMATFFEGVGVLVQKELIDINLVEDLLAQRILWWWEKLRPLSEFAREYTRDPKLHDPTEYLYNLMKQRQQVTAGNT
jgi:hypothetical protein